MTARPSAWQSAIAAARDLFWRVALRSLPPTKRDESWLEDRLFGRMLDEGRHLLVTADDFLWATAQLCSLVGCDALLIRTRPGHYVVEVSRDTPTEEIGAMALALTTNAAPGCEVVVRMKQERRMVA